MASRQVWFACPRALLVAELLLLLIACAEGEVRCGGHSASDCSLCPQGQEPLWCNGDCIWRGGMCKARTGAFNSVSCGGHEAASCSDCHGDAADEQRESWCNGDCIWNDWSRRCVLRSDSLEIDPLLEELGRLGRRLGDQPALGNFATFIRNAIVGSGSRQKQSEKLESHMRSESCRQRHLDALFHLLRSPRSDSEAKDVENLVMTTLQWHSDERVRSKIKKTHQFFDIGLFSDILHVCDELNGLDPHYSEAWYQRSLALLRLGRREESLKDLDRALQLEPRHFGALVAKGELLASAGLRSEALQCLQQVKEVHPRLQCKGLEGLLELAARRDSELPDDQAFSVH